MQSVAIKNSNKLDYINEKKIITVVATFSWDKNSP